MDDVFDSSKIKKLDLSELNGKTLQIVVVENEDAVLVAGKDTTTGDLYVLNYTEKHPLSGFSIGSK